MNQKHLTNCQCGRCKAIRGETKGKNNPHYGHYRYNISKEFLLDEYINNKKSMAQIAREIKCTAMTIFYKLVFYNIPKRNSSEMLKGRKRPEHSKKMKGRKNPANSKRMKGKNHPNFGNRGKDSFNYIHGLSNKPYPLEFNKELKYKIRERDNFKCQNCDMIEEEHLIVYGYALDVHHIDYNKINCKEENLITLCRQCNLRANSNRKYWKNFFLIKK